MKTFLLPGCRCFVATTLVPISKQKEGFFPVHPISGLPCLQSFHMINRLINLQGKMRKGKKKMGAQGKGSMDKLKCHFPACNWMLLPLLSLSHPLFFFSLPFWFFWFGYKSQDVIGTGTDIKQHDLARFLPVPPRHPCWLREIKEGGGGSEGGRQRRESPDNSAAACLSLKGFSSMHLLFI